MDTIEVCPVCGITRINNVFHYQYRNTPTTSIDVAGVVCSNILYNAEKSSECINPDKSNTTGENF